MVERVSPNRVKELLRRFALAPKKSLGQNFLVDHNILVKIAESCGITGEQYLFEIGPGMGGLTQELARRCKAVLAVELDDRLVPLLTELRGEIPNLEIICADVLKIDIETELCRAFGLPALESYQICANIPYNITTPIIFKLLEQCPRMRKATLMMQKEVGARLMASPGGKDYGRLTIMAAYYAEVEHVMDVSRNCFYPRPDVDSVVIRLKPRSQPIARLYDETAFKGFVGTAFTKRRKTILNITSEFFACSKTDAGARIEAAGLQWQLRPENLGVTDIIRLVNMFKPEYLVEP